MSAAAVQTAGPDLQLVDLEARPAHPVATVEPRAARASDIGPMQMLQLAVQSGDLEKTERFWKFVQDLRAFEAEQAFTEAMTRFKLNAPDIYKTKTANFGTTRSGAEGASYAYADHASVVLPIAKGLAQHGFTHDWNVEQPGDGFVHVTCILTHVGGHKKHVHLYASPDNSGGKNGIQSISSTNSYLQRITLLAVTGLSTQSMGDNDGHNLPAPAANDAAPARTDAPFDGPYVGEQQRAAAPAAPAGNFYSADEFAAKSPDWIAKIKTGGERNHPDRLIPFVESRGKKFTDDQKSTLRAASAA